MASKAQLFATMKRLFSSLQALFEFQASLVKQESIGSERAERKQPWSPAFLQVGVFLPGRDTTVSMGHARVL